jgi:hypothetical protein
MKIKLEDDAMIGDLLAFLRDEGCIAYNESASGTIEAIAPRAIRQRRGVKDPRTRRALAEQPAAPDDRDRRLTTPESDARESLQLASAVAHPGRKTPDFRDAAKTRKTSSR